MDLKGVMKSADKRKIQLQIEIINNLNRVLYNNIYINEEKSFHAWSNTGSFLSSSSDSKGSQLLQKPFC